MCFSIHPGYPEPRTAKKDIVCYKCMDRLTDNGHLISLHLAFEYEFGKEYSLEGTLKKHSCLGWQGYIDKGYHSFSNKKELRSGTGIQVKCIIPKGSTYYYNPYWRQYVSDRIKIVERIKG